ncbi:rod shape-determining protein RodA, partial [Solemya velum gill symbiont]
HHLLIDVAKLPAIDQPVPADDQHKHFGGGQTEATIDLSPGEHTLQLLLGDMNHIPHNPPVVSNKITITVK